MKIILIFSSLFLFSNSLFAQPNYIDTAFIIRKDTNIVYAIDTNYAGRLDTLKLDIYKPISDNNRFRPVFVLLYGGAWMFGTKTDAEVVLLATYMAKRGYVVATIKYRLGFHMSNNVPNPILRNPLDPNDQNPSQCVYPADTSEMIRANYRGMQDAKSAIRFMRQRSLQDSTCILNYYVGGYSAGGFIALQTAFMDNANEKPIDALAISDAPIPDAKLAFCKNLNNPIGYFVNRARPDLGSIEGRTNLNGHNSKVKGVANIFGGFMDRPNAMNILQGADTPAIFMYHQECDLVVPFIRGQGNAPLNQLCLPLLALTPPFQNYTPLTKIPWFLGSKFIEQHLLTIPIAQRPIYKFSPVLNGAPTGFSCLASPPCHSFPYVITYSDTLARFFKPIINATESNTASNCLTATSTGNITLSNKVNVYPNPFQNSFYVELPKSYNNIRYILFDELGRTILNNKLTTATQIFIINNLKTIPKGFYSLQIITNDGVIFKKMVK